MSIGRSYLALCAGGTAVAAVAFGLPVAVALLLAAAAAAGCTDAWEFRIPNPVALLAAAAAVLVWGDAGYPPEALLVTLIVGVLLLIAFTEGAMGGGDVKLIPSLILGAGSAGDPLGLYWRLALFLIVLLGTGIFWALARGEKDVPLAVGGALALAVAVS